MFLENESTEMVRKTICLELLLLVFFATWYFLREYDLPHILHCFRNCLQAATSHYPELYLSNSCFVGNVASKHGALVNVGKHLRKNTNNYARDNSVGTVPPWSTCSSCGAVCDDGVYEPGSLVGITDDECHRFGSSATSCLPEPCLSDDPPCSEIPTLVSQAEEDDCTPSTNGGGGGTDNSEDTCTGNPGRCGLYDAYRDECNQIAGCSWQISFGGMPTGCYGDPWACWKFNGNEEACRNQGSCQWKATRSGGGRCFMFWRRSNVKSIVVIGAVLFLMFVNFV